MALALSICTARIYSYVDTTLKSYAQTFYVPNTDHFVYWTFHTQELQQLIDALNKKGAELDSKQQELEGWQSQLQKEKASLDETRNQIEGLKNGISSLIVSSRADEAKNLKTLSATYAAMEPNAVVGIMSEMEENTAVKILALMKPDTVGPIFEAMTRLPGQEGQMRARIARLSEKLRLYKQVQDTK